MKYFSTFSLAAALLFSISVNAQTSADTAPLPALNPASVKSIESVKNDTGRGRVSNLVANAIAAGGGGAWSGSSSGGIEYTKGVVYSNTPISPVGFIPAGSSTTMVYWTYSFDHLVPGQRTFLCNYARCIEITGSSQGGSSQFSGDNPNAVFKFSFGVTGNGPLIPIVNSGQDQVIVNYQ